MTFIYSRFWFEANSRLTGVWRWPWRGNEDADDLCALISHVWLGPGQDPSLEYDFMCSHLQWAIGGIHGVGPDGRPWLVIVQCAPASASALVGTDNPWWAMVDGLERALELNPEAQIHDDARVTRQHLLGIYQTSGVDGSRVADWSTIELAEGLLAECAYVPLQRIAEGRDTGCPLPDLVHDCTHDMFTDVFQAWAQGRLAVPLDGSVDDEEYDDDDADEDDDDEEDEPALRRVMLGQSRSLLSSDYVVVAVWVGDSLHVAQLDFGDGPETTEGFDIDQPLELLGWLVSDRFGTSVRTLVEYAERFDLTVRRRDLDQKPSWGREDIRLTVDDDVAVAIAADQVWDIDDWQALTLCLLRDRCEGGDAMGRVQSLLASAGLTATPRDRGYV